MRKVRQWCIGGSLHTFIFLFSVFAAFYSILEYKSRRFFVVVVFFLL